MKTFKTINDGNDLTKVEILANVYIISLVLSKHSNVTLHLVKATEGYNSENVTTATCSLTLGKVSHPKFRPELRVVVKSTLMAHQHVGLTFDNVHLRFISRHEERKFWTHQLLELIYTFDIKTWVLLVLSAFILSYITKFCKDLFHKTDQQLADIFFPLLMSWLDQGCSLFNSLNTKSNVSFYFAMWLIPLSYFFFETIYRGDNITRLTSQPPLKPFDTFDSLIDNGLSTIM